MIRAAIVVAFLPVLSAFAATTVLPTDLSGWATSNSNCGAGLATGSIPFVSGPATPPLGVGSAQLNIGSDGDSFVGFRRTAYNGLLVNTLTQLSYSTYTQVDGSGGQSPRIELRVDYNGDFTTDDLLVFEPLYQGPAFFPSNPQGPLVTGTWQTWDALNGGWWSANATGGATPGAGVKSLATILAAQPNARFAALVGGAFRIIAGCGGATWANYVGNIDNVNVRFGSGAVETYDFEPTPTVTIDDLSQSEGTGGTTNFDFLLTLSHPVSQGIGVNYGTADDTALAADNDYTPVPPAGQTAFFAPNTTTTTLTIVVTADNKPETDETFFVNLTSSGHATVSDAQAIGTIVNDDGPGADLSIEKTGPAQAITGQNIEYTITVTNNGPESATSVVVTDTIPAGTTFVSADPSQGTCDGTTTVTCTLGTIPNGGTATISLIVTAPSTPTSITNTATVTNPAQFDPTPANDADTTEATVGLGAIPTMSGIGLVALVASLLALAVMKLR